MPTNYNPARSYPLVFFFHGGGGDENLFTNGAPVGWPGYANFTTTKVFASFRQQATDPAIVVWPTLRAGDGDWYTPYVQQATNLLNSLIAQFNIDTNRLYVGGLSAGGPPAWDLLGLRRGFFAAAMIMGTGPGSAVATLFKDVPFWVFDTFSDETGNVYQSRDMVRTLRLGGVNTIYTEYVTPGHIDGIGMSLCTPVTVDWLLAQRRGVATTNQPVLSITSPTQQPVLPTGVTNLDLAGSAAALDRAVSQVAWTNYANNAKGVASGTNLWSATNIPLVQSKTNGVVVVAVTTTSWAPAFGGSTTFSDTLTVIQSPIQATLTLQGTEALLNWSGGGPPYRVQRATDLAAGIWTDCLADATPPVHLSPTNQAGFYRIVGQ